MDLVKVRAELTWTQSERKIGNRRQHMKDILEENFAMKGEERWPSS